MKVWEKTVELKIEKKRGASRYLSLTSELLTIQAFISEPRAD